MREFWLLRLLRRNPNTAWTLRDSTMCVTSVTICSTKLEPDRYVMYWIFQLSEVDIYFRVYFVIEFVSDE
jgi:hypothetical protein